MNKRAQFYLIGAIIIIALSLGFIALSNTLSKTSFQDLEDSKRGIGDEVDNVMDYAYYNQLSDLERKELLIDFAQNYSEYSRVENLYFVFGDSSEVVVAGYRRENSGRIYVGSDNLTIQKDEFTYDVYTPSGNSIILTINNIEHPFSLNEGQNFYFVMSEEDNMEQYIFTGSSIKDLREIK